MNDVVIGLGYGDEGKGLVTDYLASKNTYDACVRYSGGPQAGHTVLCEDKEHVFNTWGSATFRNIDTVLTSDVLVDLFCIDEETERLQSLDLKSSMIVPSYNCELITPFDVLLNRKLELQRQELTGKVHGSCGRGINTTKRRVESGLSLKFGDIILDIKDDQNYSISLKLLKIKDYYLTQCKLHDLDPGSIDHVIDFTIENWRKILSSLSCESSGISICTHSWSFSNFTSYIFESSQGILLDEDYGTMPYCTPSKVGLQNINKYNLSDLKVNGVTRIYSTRHGAGPLHFECKKEDLGLYYGDSTNVTNPWQHHLRYAPLNFDLLKYAVSKTGLLDRLFVTHLDEYKKLVYPMVSNNQIVQMGWPKIKSMFKSLVKPDGELFYSLGPTAKDIKEW